jgi:hypothetical protein
MPRRVIGLPPLPLTPSLLLLLPLLLLLLQQGLILVLGRVAEVRTPVVGEKISLLWRTPSTLAPIPKLI